MNLRHLHENELLRDKLAAEYVLGTLKGGARRRFEAWLRADALLTGVVAQWQSRLVPLAEFAPGVTPSPRVWREIERVLGLHAKRIPRKRSFFAGLLDDLNFWRGLGVTATALATLLVVVLVAQGPDSRIPAATYVATLTNEQAQPVAVITGNLEKRQMTVRVLAQQAVADDRSLELWAVPKEGAPRSLGLVAANGTVTLDLPQNVTPESVPLLAISLEPKGGSPNPNAPTGPILFKGAWVQI